MKRLNEQAGCVLLGLVSPFLLCCSRRGGPAFHQDDETVTNKRQQQQGKARPSAN